MKSHQKEYPDISGKGADEVRYKMAMKTAALFPDLGYNPNIKDHWVLTPQDDGNYMLKHAKTGELTPPEDGKPYIFITMPPEPDGTKKIRIGPNFGGGNGHAKLSGFAPYVSFAGELRFENCRPSRANCQTGTYVTPQDHPKALSGLDCEFDDLSFEEGTTAVNTTPPQQA